MTTQPERLGLLRVLSYAAPGLAIKALTLP